MLLTLHVRGETLCGGAQKVKDLSVTNVEDLKRLLEKHLRPAPEYTAVKVESLRYLDGDFDEYVLLTDLSDLPASGKAKLEVVSPPREIQASLEGDVHRREMESLKMEKAGKVQELEKALKDLRSAREIHSQCVRATACYVHQLRKLLEPCLKGNGHEVAEIVEAFRRFKPFRPAGDQFEASDAVVVDEFTKQVDHAPREHKVQRFTTVLQHSLQHVVDTLLSSGAKAVEEAHRAEALFRDDNPATPQTPPAAHDSSCWVVENTHTESSSKLVPAGTPHRTVPVYVQMQDTNRRKVITIDPSLPSCFTTLRESAEEKFRAHPKSLKFHYTDEEGYQWEVDDADTLLGFLKRAGEGDPEKSLLTCVSMYGDYGSRSPQRGDVSVAVSDANGVWGEEAWRAKWVSYLDKYDVDNSGTLSSEELCRLLRQEGSFGWLDDDTLRPPNHRNESFLQGKVESIMKQFDINHDGKVSFDEFCLLMLKLSQI